MNLSIIIPVYNVENYILECLESIYKESNLSNYEVLCIDDCGKDKSVEIIKEYVRKNKINNLQIIRHDKNAGLSAARNTGIKNANGKYVYFLDSDDMINSCGLEKIVKQCIKNDLDIAEANYTEIFETSEKISTNNEKNDLIKEDIVYSGDTFFELMMKTNYTPMVWRRIYKNSYLKKNSIYFQEGLKFEDEEFTPRAILTAKRISYYDVNLYIYRRRDDSITTTMTKDNNWVNHYIKVINSLTSFSQNLNNKSRKQLNKRISQIVLSLYKNPISYGCSEENLNKIIKIVKENKIYRIPYKSSNISIKIQGFLMRYPKLFFMLYSKVNKGVKNETN